MIKSIVVSIAVLFFTVAGVSRIAASQSEAALKDEADTRVNCSYYVKPAICSHHPQCKWNGSCVPK